MAFRSNFTTVRRSRDGLRLKVNGTSEAPGRPTALHVAVAPLPPDGDPLATGLPIVDDDFTERGTLTTGIGEEWTVTVRCDPGRFELHAPVILAGAALRTEGEPFLWVQCVKLIDDDAPKP